MSIRCPTALINQFVSHEKLCLLKRLIVSQVNGSNNFSSSVGPFIAAHILIWDNSHQCTCHVPYNKEIMGVILYVLFDTLQYIRNMNMNITLIY